VLPLFLLRAFVCRFFPLQPAQGLPIQCKDLLFDKKKKKRREEFASCLQLCAYVRDLYRRRQAAANQAACVLGGFTLKVIVISPMTWIYLGLKPV
jgi:hypothetical protein